MHKIKKLIKKGLAFWSCECLNLLIVPSQDAYIERNWFQKTCNYRIMPVRMQFFFNFSSSP
jgi:hypothetical protein